MANKEKQKLEKSIQEIFLDSYKIPLYQRNFAWTKEEIKVLLQDLYESYCAYKEDNSIHYYIGTIVCLYNFQDNIYEVIDGQQRLTVLSLLAKVLGFTDKPKLFYESRPEVEQYLSSLYNLSASQECSLDNKIKNIAKETYLDNFSEAITAIYDSNLDAKSEKILKLEKF